MGPLAGRWQVVQNGVTTTHPQGRANRIDEMNTYKITSIKHTEDLDGSLDDAIARAQEINEEYQPAFGVQVELDGETVWDSEE